MSDEEAVDGAIEHDDLDPIVGLERGDDLIQLRNALRAEDVEGWMVEGDAPVERRPSFETDAFHAFGAAQCCLLGANPDFPDERLLGVPQGQDIARSPPSATAGSRWSPSKARGPADGRRTRTKSLVSGVPIANVLFSGATVGPALLPLMLYYPIQLVVYAWLARRYASASASTAASWVIAGPPPA